MSSSRHTEECKFCKRRFRIGTGNLKRHMQKEHPSCKPCNRAFTSEEALQQHLNSSRHMEECKFCDERFATGTTELSRHMTRSHAYCNPCDRYFVNEAAFQQHSQDSARHVQEFRCTVCDDEFASGRALREHECVQPEEATITAVVVDHNNFCDTCEREFRTEEAYEQHMASIIHRPICEALPCPSCKKSFIALSAFVQHLEDGGCAGGATKRIVDRAIIAADPTGVLVGAASGHVEDDEESEIEDDDEECGDESDSEDDSDDDKGVFIYTPTSSRSSSSLSLTAPKHLNCPLCPNRPAFINVRALEQHMSSPVVHAPRTYHCPTALGGGMPEKNFRAASALIHHLESEACRGGWKTLNAVVKMLNGSLKKSIGLGEVKMLQSEGRESVPGC